ncbi:MAG: hypothetical protein GEV00_23880, partial [Actinophytocola sp.]|nr:hypothetical protein [Actinophytocola sp.]
MVAYHAGAEGSEYTLDGWLGTYERMGHSTVIFVRERVHLDRIAPTSLPIVVLPRAVDLEYFLLPSIKVALYAAGNLKNSHLIRLRGIKDVFVGHGDSDKGTNVNPLARLYDEIWVAGPAARERYARTRVGVRDEAIVEVGRPQLDVIERPGVRPRAGGEPLTVLYAPTWEGWNDDEFQT